MRRLEDRREIPPVASERSFRRLAAYLTVTLSLACGNETQDGLRANVDLRDLTADEWIIADSTTELMVAILVRGDRIAALSLFVDSASSLDALAFARRNGTLLSAAQVRGLTRLAGVWRADTAIVDYSIPIRSMPAHCYAGQNTDKLQVHLRMIGGTMRIHRVPSLVC